MFRHVVMLRLSDEATDGDRDAIVDALRALPGRIPELRSYEIGVDAGIGSGNADLVIVAGFDDVDGYTVYRDHPAHREVIESLILPVLAERMAVQHEH
ncbi:MAG TPA: Dabb family protein [Microthrixaceae bacterium]|nr:Dabb family protein [Microthrixaceae bacterium]